MKTIEKNITEQFPNYSTIYSLITQCGISDEFHPFFYDIETTGLSKKTTQLYLVGVVYPSGNQWILKQWFAEQPEEEAEVLSAFLSFTQGFTHSIQYNGNHFDCPYVRERAAVHDMKSPLDELPAFDLYQYLKSWKKLLGLPKMRQADLEEYLNYTERIYPDGKTCIRHYRNYVGSSNEKDLAVCLGHNEEDLIGMGKVILMLQYQILFSGTWSYEGLTADTAELIFNLKLPSTIPVPVSGNVPGFYLHAENDTLRILCHIQQGRLRQFYPNFKDYEYLLQEDTAMHKTLSIYMDKSLKKSATPETCYTWFPVTEAFLSDSAKQEHYLKQLVPCLLNILCK